MALHGRVVRSWPAPASPLPVAPGLAQEVTGRAPVVGAGSTFAYPIVARWAKGYHRWVAGGGAIPIAGGGLDDPPSGAMLDYEPVGSLGRDHAGQGARRRFRRLRDAAEIGGVAKLGLVQFPLLIGGIVAVVNLDGVGPGQLQLTGQALADIYLGRVDNWSDPSLKALNPQIALPDAKIAASGAPTARARPSTSPTSRKASPLWKEKVGSDLLVTWPAGTGRQGQ